VATILVDPAGLGGLADRLSAAGEQLSAAGRGLHPTAGLQATPALGAAVEQFCDAWRRSLQRTGEAASVAGEQLRTAALAYQQVECAVGRACT
jgi:hypothetical protein